MSEGRTRAISRTYVQDDPSAKIWTVYLNEAEKEDRRNMERWQSEMESLLIFAGLFSASVTAFIIESYKTLVPDNTNTSVLLLARIYQRLGTPSENNGSVDVDTLLNASTFTPSISALTCNTLWFLSLGFSLSCALSAILVQQWTRHYLQSISSRESPYQRARISAYLYQGLQRFRMEEIVAIIPILMHISLLLFFAGLVEFLRPVNIAISYLVLGTLLISGSLYAMITLMPLFAYDCPYRTPLTSLIWNLCQSLNLLTRRNSHGAIVPVSCSMTKARELDATEISQQRDDRDYEAMCWVMDRLQEDSEFEPFVEFIPEVVAGFDYSAKLLIHRLLNHGHDVQTQNRDNNLQRLDYRISSLLQSCMVVQSPKYNRSNDHRQLHPIQDKEIIYRRTETCLKAIWSLTMMSPLPISGQAPTVYLSRKEIRFDERTLNLIHILRRDIVQDMDLKGLTISTCTSVTRSLLDMFIDQSWVLENEIAEFVRRGRFSDERIQIAMAQKDFTRNQSVQQLSQQLERISYELEVVILETGSKRLLGSITPNAGIEEMSVTDSNFLHQMDGLLICLDRFVTAIVLDAHDENSDQSIDGTRLELTKEATAHIRKFRGIVYHSGVLLTMEFVKCIVERLKGNGGGSMQSRDERVPELSENSNVDSLDLPLPHESLNTIRRLYLKLFQDSEHLHPTGPLDLPAADPTGPSTSLDSPVTATPTLDTLAPLSSPFRIYPEIRTLLLIYLEDALDPVYQRGGKIQEGMANVLLGLLGMVVDSEDSAYQVDDPGEKDQKKVQHNSNIDKARKVTQRYTEEFPASETATRLLAKFDGI